MAAHDYTFISRWHVAATREEVAAILADAESLPRWWDAVYLSVEREDDGVYRVRSRGWMPYTLDWRFERLHDDRPRRLSLRAWGDLQGTGEWEFFESGLIVFVWRVRAEKPLLRWCSWLLKPLFQANHRWAMAQGQEGLRREVVRRRLMQDVRC
jgi:hypothetical protein